MALFGRRKANSTQIPELQDYYATQKNENTALAWLLAFGSLLVTIAIFIGLFLGGRWVYRQFTKDDKKPTATVQVTESANQEDTPSPIVQVQPTETVTVPPVPTSVGESVPAPTVATKPATTPAQGVSPSQTPQTNTTAVSATNIPDTGAATPLVVFVAVLLLSAYAHRSYILRKNS